MPELPEVETVIRGLKKTMLGKTIHKVEVFYPKVIKQELPKFSHSLENSAIEKISRRGKNILISLSNNKTWLTHLGMTGHLFFQKSNNLPKAKHDILKIRFKNNSGELRFEDMRKFGRTYIVEENPLKAIEKLGPEPLKVSFKQFEEIFSATKRKIKPALLDQSLLAGIGNIYADESLFEAKIHPETRTDRLSSKKLSDLHQAIRKIIKKAIQTGGSSVRSYVDVEGKKGYFQIFHKVYGKEGEKCPRCKAKIKRIVVGQRSSHFCPRCQRKSLS